jgi:hypothetical protein
LSLRDNQHCYSATIKMQAATKILAKRDHPHDHLVATGPPLHTLTAATVLTQIVAL